MLALREYISIADESPRLKTLFITVPRFYYYIGTRIWKKIMYERYSAEEAKENPELYKGCVLGYLARKNSNPEDGRVSVSTYFHITALVLGYAFSSTALGSQLTSHG